MDSSTIRTSRAARSRRSTRRRTRGRLSLTGYDAAAAADVMQQSYLVIVEGRARFAQRSSLKTWLFGVVRQHARAACVAATGANSRLLSRFAAEPRRRRIRSTATIATRGVSAALRDPAAAPARRARAGDLRGIHARGSAPTVLGISLGSARTHYHRAKAAARTTLEMRDDDDDELDARVRGSLRRGRANGIRRPTSTSMFGADAGAYPCARRVANTSLADRRCGRLGGVVGGRRSCSKRRPPHASGRRTADRRTERNDVLDGAERPLADARGRSTISACRDSTT